MNPLPKHSSNAFLSKTFAACLFLSVVVWIVFGQTVHFDFVNYDDPVYVYDNPAINHGLAWQQVVWIFCHNNAGTWFPLTDVSHQLDWQLYGANAGGHHLTNVLLHALAAIFLFLALRRLTGAFWPALFVATIFAIHPLRVESVAWVVERKDVLSGLFFMLALWAWAGYVQARSKIESAGSKRPVYDPRSWTVDYYLALVFFVLGLLSKSMLVTFPFVLLLLDFWPSKRLPAGVPLLSGQWLKAGLALFLEKIPFLLITAIICVVTILTQKNAVTVAHGFTIPWRIGNAMLAYTDYLSHMFYPVGLVVAYSHTQTDPTLWKVIFAALILLVITVAAIAGLRKRPYLLVGWFWYVGMFLPVIDIMQTSHNARADRYTYLPQIGLYILITWGAMELCAGLRGRRILAGIIGAVIVAGLTIGAYKQTTYWKDSDSLWTRCIACTPDNAFAYNTKGTALAKKNKWDEAIQLYQHALKLDPDYPEALVNLGVALVNQDKRDEAIKYFERALEINPYSSEAHYDLGDALSCQGKIDEAIQQFRLALQCKPDHAGAHYDLGLNLAIQGKWDEAIPHYEQSFHLKLDQGDARYITGVALATQKKWVQAIDLYQQAIQLKPTLPEAHYRLGLALEVQKKWSEALQSLQQALTLATSQGNSALAETINAEIKSCKAAMTQ